MRRALHIRSAGHTGTLDPFATGLLVVLVGRATRLARFVEQQAKTYFATARLGTRTTTDDLTGEVLEEVAAGLESPPDPRSTEVPSRRAVEAALHSFLGPGRQRPPAYSAKHVNGERSYARARRGEAVALPESDIVVHSVDLVEYEYPVLCFRVTVSPGTYVRALVRDLGDRLGTGAHLRALRREAIGELRVEQAVALDAVSAEALRPPLAVLGHLPRVAVTEAEAAALGHGRTARPAAAPDRQTVGPVAAVGGDGRLVAIARWQDELLRPEIVLEARG